MSTWTRHALCIAAGWPGQMIVADLDFNRFFENDGILRIYDMKRHYQDLISSIPTENSDETRRRRASRNSIVCRTASAIRAKTCA